MPWKPPQARRLFGVVGLHVSVMAITYYRPLLCPSALLLVLEAVTFAAIFPDKTVWFGAHWCSLFPVHHTSIVLAVRHPLTVDQSFIFTFDGEDLKLTPPPVWQRLRKRKRFRRSLGKANARLSSFRRRRARVLFIVLSMVALTNIRQLRFGACLLV